MLSQKLYALHYLAICFLFLSPPVFSQVTLNVPADFPTVQSAIDAAVSGDTVLLAQGIYYENINFEGKDIFLTSEFIYSYDRTDIEQTIIDGSQPLYPDTGSVVRIVSGETLNAVVHGLTIQGGTGTKTYNVDEDLYFRTGGGISVDQASPTIINNIIRNNESMNTEGVVGAGGGGLRVGAGQPYIANNIITENSGRYAGGIMIAFCGGMSLKNNVISYNYTAGDFGGGGGVYVDWEDIDIINNTIVYNHSDGTGGGLCITGNTSVIKNCIIYGNTGFGNEDINEPVIRKRFGGDPMLSYTNIEGGWNDGDNIVDTLPLFIDTIQFKLSPLSPCIDAGNPDPMYFDQTLAGNPDCVLLPAKGGVRNDKGAYGGQCYQLLYPPTDECPATIDATDVSGDYCNGTTIDLSVTANPNVTYAWSSSSASVIIADSTVAVTTATLANPALCSAETVDISAIITCCLDGTELFNGVVSTVNVFPNPPDDTAELANYVDCASAAPVAGCENTITLVDDGVGGFMVTFAHAGEPDCCTGAITNVVTDGSFEAGPGSGAWVEASTNFGTPICDIAACGVGPGTGSSDGDFWAWFGGIIASEMGSVCQTVTIPSGLASLTLQFDLEVSTCDSPDDNMEVTLDGTQVFIVDGSSALCGILGYTPVVVDLLAAGIADGASYQLCFSGELFTTNADESNFFVDNVQLLAEEPPGVDPCVGSVTCEACTEDISGAIIPTDPFCDVSGIDVEITAPDGTTTTVTTSADGTFTVPGGPFPCGNYSAEITGTLPACYTDTSGPTTVDFVLDGDPATADGPFFSANLNIPTLSQWGLTVLALLLMTLGSLRLGFRTIAFESKK